MLPFAIKNLLVLAALTAPGYLAVSAARLKFRTVSGLALSLILSLVLNYLVMGILVIAGLSPTAALRFAYGAVGLAALTLLVATAVKSPPSLWNWRVVSAKAMVGYGASVGLVAVGLGIATEHFEPIFRAWDAVVSYNRWAVDWSRFTASEITYGYPQLIPANLGLIYALVGTSDHQIYGRILHIVLVVLPTLLFLDLFRLYRAPRYLVANAAYCFILDRDHVGWAAGYMDVPVAAIAFAFVYLAWLTPYLGRERSSRAAIITGAVLAAQGLVKQAGLAAVVVFGAVQTALQQSRRYRLLLLGTTAALIASWYVRAQIRLMSGADVNVMGYLLKNIHQGRDPLQRITHGLTALGDQYGYAALVVAGVSMVFATVTDRKFRRASILIIAYLPAWLLIWSYDTRNAQIMLPIFALGVGITAERVFSLLRNQFGFWRVGWVGPLIKLPVAAPRGAPLIALGAMLAATMVFSLRSEAKLVDRERNLMSTIGDPATNNYLRRAAEAGDMGDFVLTNYSFLIGIPEFRPRDIEQESFFWLDRLAAKLKSHRETTIIEIRAITSKTAQAWFAAQIERGTLTVLRENPWVRIMRYRADIL